MPQSILDAPKVPSLAPTGLNHHQKSPDTECTQHTQLPQLRLRYRPHTGTKQGSLHHSKGSGPSRINTARLSDPELCIKFADSVKKALESTPAIVTAEERWIFMRDTIHSTVLSTFGKKERQNSDGFDENLLEMEPVINPKREALVNYKRKQPGT